MKNRLLSSFFVIALYISVNAQVSPVIFFNDDPLTHNMHITSDGKNYYTVNGGRSDDGQINMFGLNGEFKASYPVKLDMRSIFYNSKDKNLYVTTYGPEIFKVVDIYTGAIELVYSSLYEDGQATPALSPNGKLLYIMDKGDIRVYNFKNGTLVKILSGFNHGKDFQTGASAVAVDDKYIYTWDSVNKNIYVYSLKGKYIQTVQIRDGEYGFSLSCANGLIFVSTDGNYKTGTWYGYALMNK